MAAAVAPEPGRLRERDWPQTNAMNGSYPLWRHLLVYANKAPNKPLDPLVKEFIKFIYSKERQAVVIKDGFFPLPQSVIEKELPKVE